MMIAKNVRGTRSTGARQAHPVFDWDRKRLLAILHTRQLLQFGALEDRRSDAFVRCEHEPRRLLRPCPCPRRRPVFLLNLTSERTWSLYPHLFLLVPTGKSGDKRRDRAPHSPNRMQARGRLCSLPRLCAFYLATLIAYIPAHFLPHNAILDDDFIIVNPETRHLLAVILLRITHSSSSSTRM